MSANASNILDLLIDGVTERLHQLGLSLSPLLIGSTLVIGLVLPSLFLLVLALSQREEPLPAPQGCRKLGLQGPSHLSEDRKSVV